MAAKYHVPAGKLEWLVDMLFQAGGTRKEVGFGEVVNLPLRWADLESWINVTDQPKMSPVFWDGLIRLSAALADQISISKSFACKAPFSPPSGDQNK